MTSWTTRKGRGAAGAGPGWWVRAGPGWWVGAAGRGLPRPPRSPTSLRRKLHKKLGQQAWLVAAITVTELLIVVKYDPHTLTLSLPFYIAQCWTLGSVLALTWTVWRFFLR